MTAELRQRMIETIQAIGEDLIRNAEQYVGEANDLLEKAMYISIYLDCIDEEIPTINIEHCYISSTMADKTIEVKGKCTTDACEITT